MGLAKFVWGQHKRTSTWESFHSCHSTLSLTQFHFDSLKVVFNTLRVKYVIFTLHKTLTCVYACCLLYSVIFHTVQLYITYILYLHSMRIMIQIVWLRYYCIQAHVVENALRMVISVQGGGVEPDKKGLFHAIAVSFSNLCFCQIVSCVCQVVPNRGCFPVQS